MFLKACKAIEATTTTQHADDKGFFSFQKAKKPWCSKGQPEIRDLTHPTKST
jgi:hypothetical protein